MTVEHLVFAIGYSVGDEQCRDVACYVPTRHTLSDSLKIPSVIVWTVCEVYPTQVILFLCITNPGCNLTYLKNLQDILKVLPASSVQINVNWLRVFQDFAEFDIIGMVNSRTGYHQVVHWPICIWIPCQPIVVLVGSAGGREKAGIIWLFAFLAARPNRNFRLPLESPRELLKSQITKNISVGSGMVVVMKRWLSRQRKQLIKAVVQSNLIRKSGLKIYKIYD